MILHQLNELKKRSSYLTYIVNHTRVKIHRLELQLDQKIDPFSYLQTSPLYPKVFWKAKNSSTITLALGSIFSVQGVPVIHTIEQNSSLPRFFGGIFFDTSYSEILWEDFSPDTFFIPKIELVLQEDKEPTLYYQYLEEDKEEPIVAWTHSIPSTLPFFTQNYIHRINTPSLDDWRLIVHKALHRFDTTPLQKVVLARASHFMYAEPIHPLSVLKHLEKQAHNCTLFAYILSDTCAFVGATPELLYQREGTSMQTEAVAGTRARGTTPEEEQILLHELMHTEKEEREFNHVHIFLDELLSTVCTSHTKDLSPSVLKTASVQHLYQTFQGVLHPLVRDHQLISQLHPTPAMGGYPKQLALDFLSVHEPFSRGHYAAPLGWISPHHTELSVAIRSAIIKESKMILFAGAGIVKGSNPDQEWEELELKIAPFFKTYAS